MKTLNQNKSIFEGACVKYDAVEEILIATPFKGGSNCWNGADWIVILSPFGLLATFYFFVIFALLKK